MITVSILDDHKVLVNSLSELINDFGEARITDVYYSISSGRLGLAKALPDVLLLDVSLPDGDSVEFCAELMKSYPQLKIIMLTSYREFNVARRALHNGALGYVLKNSEPEEIFAGIETVSRGELFLCEEFDLQKDRLDMKAVNLSPREKEVLQFIADGLTTREIAKKIFRNEENIRTQHRVLLIKMVAVNTPLLIKKAYEQNLVRLNEPKK